MKYRITFEAIDGIKITEMKVVVVDVDDYEYVKSVVDDLLENP